MTREHLFLLSLSLAFSLSLSRARSLYFALSFPLSYLSSVTSSSPPPPPPGPPHPLAPPFAPTHSAYLESGGGLASILSRTKRPSADLSTNATNAIKTKLPEPPLPPSPSRAPSSLPKSLEEEAALVFEETVTHKGDLDRGHGPSANTIGVGRGKTAAVALGAEENDRQHHWAFGQLVPGVHCVCLMGEHIL